jgi:tRNA-2-methylthio-N6-dimethylallyladenosine synthase
MASDFIVGFPGETDADFEATMSLIRDVEYAQAFSFKYSPRPGTPAATYGAQVPEAVKAQRLAELQALLEEQQYAFNRTCRGAVMAVLFDRSGRDDGRLGGRSPYLQPVQVAAPADLLGSIADVVIDAASPNSLVGRLLEAPRAVDAPAA